MAKWTRRDVVKASLAASAAIAGGDLLAESTKASEDFPAFAQAAAGSARGAASETSPLRERLLLDYGWRFALGNANDPDKDFGYGKLRGTGVFAKSGDPGGAAGPRFDDSKWRKLDLPHDWAVELPFVNDKQLIGHGAKPVAREFPETSVGWYRREFVLPAADAGKRITITFDGIFRNATIFFNGHYMATNMSGYAPVTIDVTDEANFAGDASAAQPGRPPAAPAGALGGGNDAGGPGARRNAPAPGTNVIAVRVDATLDEGWFYEGAGIYRHVWLTKTAPVHLTQSGTFVRTEFGRTAGPITSADPATVLVTSEVTNEADALVSGRVHVALVDAEGKTVGTMSSLAASIGARETHEFSMKAVVGRPKLWSCEEPNLYRAVVTLEAAGKPVDREEHTFGMRTVRFDADHGFFLNGKPVKIKGTCNHQDHAGVGAALPDRIQSYRLERLKWMGSNGCRTSHNPPTPEFMDACDRLGMLVMDETRMMDSTPEGLSQLERLIRRDRNHPSVVIWSLANEEPEQGNTRGARIVASMKRLQRKLDPTRVCTTAMNYGWGGDGVSTVVDVQGFNYGEGNIDAYHKEHPKQPCVGTETASSFMTRGVYANDEATGNVSAYGTEAARWGKTAEQWWSFYADREWLAGGFAWTGFDYRGETTPYGWPCISSHFGILDVCGFAKDPAYYYKTWWGAEPALHLLPHWNWAGKEGQEVLVVAYSNQDSVELFLNGQSQGSQPVKKNSHVEWKVKYAPGVLEARASKGGSVVLTEKRETTGAAAKIVATADRATINADGQDVAVVNVSIVDARGLEHPTADNKISFAIDGPGAVIGVGNGDQSSHEADKPASTTAAERSAFNGLCMAIVQTRRGEPGAITVKVSSGGLEAATVTITAKEAPLPPIVA
jgi:beta-galactosidase